MSENKNTLFTIGRFADLHNINKKTLMWYDRVGILKPAVIKENGYRYYTYFQSPVLETILLLRSLDVSIPEIKVFLQNRSPERLKDLLEKTVSSVDSKITELKEVKKTLVAQRDDAEFLLNLNVDEISVIEREAEYLAVLRTTKDAALEEEIELILTETKSLNLHHLHDAVYGSMISAGSIYRGDLDDYTALYIKTGISRKNKNAHVKPKGKYLRAYCKGSWDKLPCKYKEILDYAKANNIKLTGYAYETGLNDMVILSEEDYITQIEIPVLLP